MKKTFPPPFYNITSLIGTVIASVSFIFILFLILLETFAGSQKPYMGIIAFVILPAFLILGLIIIITGIIREHRLQHAVKPPERRLPRIDLNDPSHRRAFILFSIGGLVLLMFTAFGSFKAYEITDSDQFCGQLCHKVMTPEYTAYTFSPHARVGCVQCHIGPGADWFVRSKISGMYQVYATLFNKYPRPIRTPLKDLRPAQETCEQCHWPKHFFSEKLKFNTYFLSNEQNSRSTLNLLLKIGGGNVEAGPTSGIHWYMIIANEVTYAETDPQRLVIPWVSSKRLDGKVRIYRSIENPITEEELRKAPKRRLDCIDCHNRPTHIYHPAPQSVNDLMALGWIDPKLPNIKRVAVNALEEPYSTTQAGLEGIRHNIDEYYRNNYPEIAETNKAAIQRAITELEKTYSRNYFPFMNVSWRKFPNHIGHMYSPGCFRCHDGKHVSDDGKVLTRDCNICHTIYEQKFEEEKPSALVDVGFRHPSGTSDAWKRMLKLILEGKMNCYDCHGVH